MSYGCGPEEAVSWCSINHSGICGLDTASFEEMDRLASRCGHIKANNRYLLWKYGVPFKELICGNCGYYEAGEYSQGMCVNEQVNPHTKGVKVNSETKYVDSKEYFNGAHACSKFIKRGNERREAEEEVAKQKQSLKEQYDALILELQNSFSGWEHLKTNGGQDPFWSDGCNMNLVHNHICYGKTKIEELCNTNGLELPEIYHRETPPEVDKDYMAKEEEIRENAVKSIALYKADENYQFLLSAIQSLDKKQKEKTCISNVINYVTGLERAIEAGEFISMRRHENPETYTKSFLECAEKVRKFDGIKKVMKPAKESKPEMCNSCDNEYERGCLPPKSEDNCVSYVGKQETCETIETCETCGHSEDYGESVEYIKCAAGTRRKDVKKSQIACSNYIPDTDEIEEDPEGDLEEQLDELLKDGDEKEKQKVCSDCNKFVPDEDKENWGQCDFDSLDDGGSIGYFRTGPDSADICDRFEEKEIELTETYIYRGLV